MMKKLAYLCFILSFLTSCSSDDAVMKSIVGNWKSEPSASETFIRLSIHNDLSAVLFYLDENGDICAVMSGNASYDGKMNGTLCVEAANEPESLMQFKIKATSTNSFQLLVGEYDDVWAQVNRVAEPSVPTSIVGTWSSNSGEGGEYILHIGSSSNDTALIFTEGSDIVAYQHVGIEYDSQTGLGELVSENFPWSIAAASVKELVFSFHGEKICSMQPIEWAEGYPSSLEGFWQWKYIDNGKSAFNKFELTYLGNNLYSGRYSTVVGKDISGINVSVIYDPTTGKGTVYDPSFECLFDIQGIHPDMFFMSFHTEDPESESAGTFTKK